MKKLPKGQDDCMAISKQALRKDHHAKLTIHNLDEMSKKDIKRLWVWLDEIAAQIIGKKPNEYAKTSNWKLMK